MPPRPHRSILGAAAVVVLLVTLPGPATGTVLRSDTTPGLPAAEDCPAAIHASDARSDTRSWTLPPPSGTAAVPRSADLTRFELHATKAGVCIRWTTAAPASPGTTFVFIASGPWVREASGAQVARGYSFDLDLGKHSARATSGLVRIGGTAKHVLRVRAGQTGTVVSAFFRREWLTPPANQRDGWRYVYRAFSFEARVLSSPDAKGNRRVDFYPGEGGQPTAGYINGALCGPPCHDPRFTPH